MAGCLSCDTCSPWWCPACQEEVCNWFETEDHRHRKCGTERPRVVLTPEQEARHRDAYRRLFGKEPPW